MPRGESFFPPPRAPFAFGAASNPAPILPASSARVGIKAL
jgi:hypothetical protein